MPLIRVALPVPLRRCFDYLIPQDDDAARWQSGCRVKVSFGKKQLIGVIIGQPDSSDIDTHQLKMADALLDTQPLLPETLFKLLLWAANYYQHPLGEVLTNALPVLLRKGEAPQTATPNYWQLTEQGRAIELSVARSAPRQWRAVQLLEEGPLQDAVLREEGIDSQVVKKLSEKGWVEPASPPEPKTAINREWTLTSEQALAVTAMTESLHQFNCFLLEGVTGSGKTQVYLELIGKVIAQGKQALVLVPEIGLTPQTRRRFEQFLGTEVALLHSNLTDRERLYAWNAARTGKVNVVLGTRSALFTPLAKPGLIVVDEEHDASYKQQDGFRYNGRDLAVLRANREGVPVVLGTATPSLESLANVKQGRYRHLELKNRPGGYALPRIGLLDMRKQPQTGPLAASLIQLIRQHLHQQGQVLLFLNRRGYAPVVLCHECGWHAECTRCNKPYTWHQRLKRLQCHHCGSERPLPKQCAHCGSIQLQPAGHGTERLEETLQQLFPSSNIARIDRDTTRNKQSFHTFVEGIRKGEFDILVGTQMLAKGHDFPNVTLVGMIDMDGALFSSDFRAGERLAQLLTQVAGRAGRAGRKAEVVLQTHYPDHDWVQQLVVKNYHQIATELLAERKMAMLPPYSCFALLRAEAHQPQLSEQFLHEVEALLTQAMDASHPIMIMSAHPCTMERRGGRYRWQLLLSAEQRTTIQRCFYQVAEAITKLPSARQVRWHLDIDPQDFA